MASFSGKPSEINRFLGYCDIQDPTELPLGLAALCLNSDFTLTSVMTRAGVNLMANGSAAGIRGLNKQPITGLMGLNYIPQNVSEAFYQLPVIFDRQGALQVERAVGSGVAELLTSDLFVPPATAHMVGTQAYNKAWMAFSDLISPQGNPDSPTDGMAVLNLQAFQYGDASTALDPYGMKPYGWSFIADTKVLEGEVITPSQPNVNGHTYQVVQAGKLGVEPSPWPTTAGATVTCGTAVLQEKTPNFTQVYPCYPPFPMWTVNGSGGSWPTDANGNALWLYFVYTYVTAAGETDIQKGLVGLAALATTNESFVFTCPAPPPAPPGFPGNLPTGWNLYIGTSVAGSSGLPDWGTFQKFNPNPYPFDTPETVTQILANGTPPQSNTAQVVGAGNCDAYELIDDIKTNAGTGVSGSLYELGIRYATLLFVNRNYSVSGFIQEATVPVRLTSNGSTILAQNLPYGPENTIARIVAFTELQFDQTDPKDLPFTAVPSGGQSSGSQSQTASPTVAAQWRVIESDGNLNKGSDDREEWELINTQWRTIDGWGDPARLLQPIFTQNMGFAISPGTAITGIQFDLQWLNQGGGAAGTLVNAQLSYQGNPIGTQKQLNIPSNGVITDNLVGGNGDLWGASLSADIIDDPTFGVEFQINQGAYNGTSHRLFIDYVKLTVFFSLSESLTLPMARGTNAGPYFYIGNFVQTSPDVFVFPQTTLSGGYNESATVIEDNSSDSAHFSYTDPYLIGSQGTDVTDRLQVIWPYPCVDIFYSPSTSRMFQTGVPGFNGHWVSLANDPESYYGNGDSFIPTENNTGERAICVREFRGTLYSLRERSGYVMIPNTAAPSGWDVVQRWDKVGPCGPRAVDVCGRFMIFVHRSGIQLYSQEEPEPVKVSKEIRYLWQTINWQAEQTIWVAIDEETHTVRVGVPTNGSPVPNRVLKIYYEEGFGMPIHFSTFKGSEISMDQARRYSIDDIQANLGLRIERTIPFPPPQNQGPDGITTLDGTFYTSQFLFGSSGPNGCVLAVTPGIWHDGEGVGSEPVGIDWQYETVCAPEMMRLCKIEGANINARGNGPIFPSFLPGRDVVTGWDEAGTPTRGNTEIRCKPFDLTVNQQYGVSIWSPKAKTSEFWRMRFTNGKVADVWAELKYLVMFAVPWASGRAASEMQSPR